MFFFSVFRGDLLEVVQVERALRIDALVDPEELAALHCNQGMVAVGTLQGERLSGISAGDEGLATDLASVLTAPAGVVIDVLVRSTADRTDRFFRDVPSVAPAHRFHRLTILPLVVLEQEFPVLFFERDDKGWLVNRELLVLRGMGIVKRPLLERNVSADKVQ